MGAPHPKPLPSLVPRVQLLEGENQQLQDRTLQLSLQVGILERALRTIHVHSLQVSWPGPRLVSAAPVVTPLRSSAGPESKDLAGPGMGDHKEISREQRAGGLRLPGDGKSPNVSRLDQAPFAGLEPTAFGVRFVGVLFSLAAFSPPQELKSLGFPECPLQRKLLPFPGFRYPPRHLCP